MLARSLTIVLLSVPASFALVGIVLTLVPMQADYMLPTMLMVFPLWIGIICVAYLVTELRRAAAFLVGIIVVSGVIIAALRFMGLPTV
jgi:hypothetical protein